MARINPLYAARKKRGQKEMERRIHNPWPIAKRSQTYFGYLGQAVSLRVRPGAFLFDLARLYTQA
jgi:hypothetical protein